MYAVQVRHISTVGGVTVKECTRHISRYVMRDCCAKDFNWKGKGNKRALSKTTLCSVILRKLVVILVKHQQLVKG